MMDIKKIFAHKRRQKVAEVKIRPVRNKYNVHKHRSTHNLPLIFDIVG